RAAEIFWRVAPRSENGRRLFWDQSAGARHGQKNWPPAEERKLSPGGNSPLSVSLQRGGAWGGGGGMGGPFAGRETDRVWRVEGLEGGSLRVGWAADFWGWGANERRGGEVFSGTQSAGARREKIPRPHAEERI